MIRDIQKLLSEYEVSQTWDADTRSQWLVGLEAVEGANLFSMIHNEPHTDFVRQEIYDFVEALNSIDYHQKMVKLAAGVGVKNLPYSPDDPNLWLQQLRHKFLGESEHAN